MGVTSGEESGLQPTARTRRCPRSRCRRRCRPSCARSRSRAGRWAAALALSPWSMAGLPARRACVLVLPAVVGQRAELRVDRVGGRAHDVAVDAVGEAGAAGAVADQVVPLAGEGAGHVRPGAGEVDQVQGDDRVPDVERAARDVEEAAAGVGDVLGDGAVEQRRRRWPRCRRRRSRRSCR